jgi:D-alanine transaminase
MVDDMGLVTEGSSTNAWIIDEHGKLRTRDTQANILKGCTRTTLLDILKEEGIELEERAFTVEEAQRAKEAFFTAAGAFVMPAVSIDGVKIGDGKPGPVATRLRELYIERGTRDAV